MRRSETLTITRIEQDSFQASYATVRALNQGGPSYYLPVPLAEAAEYHVGATIMVTVGTGLEAAGLLDDQEAMGRIHDLLDGSEWDSAADYLESIAEIVKKTGRTIRPQALEQA